MSEAIKPIDYEARRQSWLLRRLMPAVTHVCTRCWGPLFSADEPHQCVLPKGGDK